MAALYIVFAFYFAVIVLLVWLAVYLIGDLELPYARTTRVAMIMIGAVAVLLVWIVLVLAASPS